MEHKIAPPGLTVKRRESSKRMLCRCFVTSEYSLTSPSSVTDTEFRGSAYLEAETEAEAKNHKAEAEILTSLG